MRASIVTVGTVFFLFFAHAEGACTKPDPITIPDGTTATEEEMVSAGEDYKDYMLSMQLYQSCLENDADSQRLSSTDQSKSDIEEQESAFNALHNAASNEMSGTTEDFNRAVEDYKLRQ